MPKNIYTFRVFLLAVPYISFFRFLHVLKLTIAVLRVLKWYSIAFFWIEIHPYLQLFGIGKSESDAIFSIRQLLLGLRMTNFSYFLKIISVSTIKSSKNMFGADKPPKLRLLKYTLYFGSSTISDLKKRQQLSHKCKLESKIT